MRSRLQLAIALQKVKIIQLIAGDDLAWLATISNHCDLVVKCNHSDFAFICMFRHIYNLRLDCCLQTLHSGNVGFVFVRCVKVLI